MNTLTHQFIQDEAGFIVSAELVLVATIVVLGMIVGLSEVSHSINQELEDVASAFGAINQSYYYNGLSGCNGQVSGSCFTDSKDECDGEFDIQCLAPSAESGGSTGGGNNGGGHGGGHGGGKPGNGKR